MGYGVEVENGRNSGLRIRAVTQEPSTDDSQNSHFRFSPWVTVYGTPSKYHHGDAPGKPTLVTTGTNAPTASTLSFTIPCVTPGKSYVTNYTL